MIRGFLAVGLPAIVLFMIVQRSVGTDAASRIAAAGLSAGLGIAWAGAGFLVWRFAVPSEWLSDSAFVDAAFWALLALIALRIPAMTSSTERLWTRESRLVACLALGVAGLSAAHFCLRSSVAPHGEWDAWAIWNLKARFMVRGGDDWRDLFSTALTHPGYPLLLPSAVARLWVWLGTEAPAAGVIVAAGFTYATPLVVAGSLAYIKGWTSGAWGGLLVIAAVPFTFYGGWQVADVPFGFLVLASVVLIAFDTFHERTYRFAILAGASIGLAGLVKNEGLPFVIGMTAAYGAYQLIFRTGPLKERGMRLMVLVLAIAPSLVLLSMIHDAAPAVGMSAALTGSQATDKMTDIGRHGEIARAFAVSMWNWAGVWFVGAAPVFAVTLWLGGRALRRELRAAAGFGVFVIVSMLGAYYAAYLVSPYDLTWHLSTSLHRILTHLWPTFVWTFCLVVSFDPPPRLDATRAIDAGGVGANDR